MFHISLTKEETDLVDEGEVVLGGGAATTPRPLRVITYHLHQNPALFQRLRQELRTIQPLGDPKPMKLQ